MEERRRVKGRFASKDGTESSGEKRGGAKKPLRPKQCREFAQRRMAEALPEIVDRFIREAKQGSIPHAKALASLSGLDQVEAPNDSARVRAQARRRRSLTEMLMQELKRGREECNGGSTEA